MPTQLISRVLVGPASCRANGPVAKREIVRKPGDPVARKFPSCIMKPSRRRFLAAASAFGTAALIDPARLSAKTAEKKKPKGFLIGACDWTLGKRTNPEALLVAKRIGLDGVQVDFGGSADSQDLPLFDPQLQKMYLDTAKRNEVKIASLAMGNLNSVAYKSDPRAERWVSQAVNVAKAMQQRIILLAFFGNGDLKNDPKGVENTIERLKKVAPKAEKAKVTLGIESWLSAREHLHIIESVGSPAVKVYYDVANSNKMGYDICSEIRQLGPKICQFHAKDYKDLYGKGEIDFPAVRRAMDDIKYRGWLVMEGTKMPLGREESCKYDERYLRTIFPRKA